MFANVVFYKPFVDPGEKQKHGHTHAASDQPRRVTKFAGSCTNTYCKHAQILMQTSSTQCKHIANIRKYYCKHHAQTHNANTLCESTTKSFNSLLRACERKLLIAIPIPVSGTSSIQVGQRPNSHLFTAVPIVICLMWRTLGSCSQVQLVGRSAH